jgi:hypothetical protein
VHWELVGSLAISQFQSSGRTNHEVGGRGRAAKRRTAPQRGCHDAAPWSQVGCAVWPGWMMTIGSSQSAQIGEVGSALLRLTSLKGTSPLLGEVGEVPKASPAGRLGEVGEFGRAWRCLSWSLVQLFACNEGLECFAFVAFLEDHPGLA